MATSPGFMGFPIEAAAAGGLGNRSTRSTGNTTISSSGYYDNSGASGTITFTFAGTSGIEAFITRVASQEVRIAPVSGSQILRGQNALAVDEYLRLLGDGASVHAIVNPDGDVKIIAEDGQIVEQTP